MSLTWETAGVASGFSATQPAVVSRQHSVGKLSAGRLMNDKGEGANSFDVLAVDVPLECVSNVGIAPSLEVR